MSEQAKGDAVYDGEVVLPDENVIQGKVSLIVSEANAIQITSQAHFVRAVEFKKAIKVKINEVKTDYKEAKEAADRSHKKVCELERKALSRLLEADQIIDKMIKDYHLEQEKVRRAEEEAARKVAEEEAKRQAEEDALSHAIELESMGEVEEAKEVLAQPIVSNVVPMVPVVQRAVPKVAGFSLTEKFSAEVTDLKALILAVAKGLAPVGCLKADESFLNKQAAAWKEEMKYPGVKVVRSLKSNTRT